MVNGFDFVDNSENRNLQMRQEITLEKQKKILSINLFYLILTTQCPTNEQTNQARTTKNSAVKP